MGTAGNGFASHVLERNDVSKINHSFPCQERVLFFVQAFLFLYKPGRPRGSILQPGILGEAEKGIRKNEIIYLCR